MKTHIKICHLNGVFHFGDHFESNLKPNILEYSARWILEKLNMYDPFSGVTNNVSESMNKVLKDLTKWKRCPIDCVMLSMWHIQRYYMVELSKGRAHLGKFSLKEEFSSYAIDADEIPKLDKMVDPTNIVSFIKDCSQGMDSGIHIQDNIKETVNESILEKCVVSSNDKEEQTVSISNDYAKDKLDSDVTADDQAQILEESGEENTIPRNLWSQEAKAKFTIVQNGVQHITEKGCFVVQGHGDTKYLVTLSLKLNVLVHQGVDATTSMQYKNPLVCHILSKNDRCNYLCLRKTAEKDQIRNQELKNQDQRIMVMNQQLIRPQFCLNVRMIIAVVKQEKMVLL